MPANRPLRAHVKPFRPAPRAPGPRPAVKSARSRNMWQRESRRSIIAAVAVAFVVGGSVSVYAVHSHLTQAAERARALALHNAALETSAALGSGSVLFVPEYGNNCRRRFLDNSTGKLRDGGHIHCDDAVGWNATTPTREQKVEQRMDAIRNGFQSRNTGAAE